MHVFRADASPRIGIGHLMRCSELAERLRSRGADVSFVCRKDTAGAALIRAKGFAAIEIAADSESEDAHSTAAVVTPGSTVIMDHYSLGAQWESIVRSVAARIMVIDDLADRKHACDILLDQNFHPNLEARYIELVPTNCKRFLGPQFALLRDEFFRTRTRVRCRDRVSSVLVTFGGGDEHGLTGKSLDALQSLPNQIEVDVIIGTVNPACEQLEARCAQLGFQCHVQVKNMAELMLRSDLAVGAAGSSNWERCILGLPAITIATAANQVEVDQSLSGAGACMSLGWHQHVTSNRILESLQEFISQPQLLFQMSENAIAIMKNSSPESLERVVSALLE